MNKVRNEMKKILVESFEQFEREFETLSNSAQNLSTAFYFVASNDKQTGTSWCSDCRKAKPIMDQVEREFSDKKIVVVQINVGQRDEWKRENNPYRIGLLKVNAVPTLCNLNGVSI